MSHAHGRAKHCPFAHIHKRMHQKYNSYENDIHNTKKNAFNGWKPFMTVLGSQRETAVL